MSDVNPNNRFLPLPPNLHLMEDVESPLMLYLNLRGAHCYALYRNQWRYGTVTNRQWPQGSPGLEILLLGSTQALNYGAFMPHMVETPPSEQPSPPQPEFDFFLWRRCPKMTDAATQTSGVDDSITVNILNQPFPLNFFPLNNGNRLFMDPLWVPFAGNYPLQVRGPGSYPLQVPYTSNYPLQVPYTSNYPLQVPYTSNYPSQVPFSSNYPMQVPGTGNYPMQVPGAGNYPMQVPGAGNHPLHVPCASNYPLQVPCTDNYIVDLHGRLLRPKANGLLGVARSGHYDTEQIEDLFRGV